MFLCVLMSLCVCLWRSNPPLRTKTSNEQEEESLDERPKNLMKQKQLITQHRDLAEKMEHPFSVLEKMSEPKSEGVLRTM